MPPFTFAYETLGEEISPGKVDECVKLWDSESYQSDYSLSVATPFYNLFTGRFSTDLPTVGFCAPEYSGFEVAKDLFDLTAKPEIAPYKENFFNLVRPGIEKALSTFARTHNP